MASNDVLDRKLTLEDELARRLVGVMLSGKDNPRAQVHQAVGAIAANIKRYDGRNLRPQDVKHEVQDIMQWWSSDGFNPMIHANMTVNRLFEKSRMPRQGRRGKRLKIWQTMGDERVRQTHAVMDNVAVPIDQPFVVGGFKMMHPGDESMGAPFSEIVNCRCSLVYD